MSTRAAGGGHYWLGVDIGNAWVTAAVADGAGVETVPLGPHAPGLPALVHVDPQGAVRTGDDAAAAAAADPWWTVDLLVRRLDDPAPVRCGRHELEVADLLGRVLRDVLDRVTAQRAGPPAGVVLTRPAALGPRGRDRLVAAAARAGRPDATTTTAPLALGAWFLASSRPERTVAVYDFGAGSCETAVLRVHAPDVELACRSDGVPRLGGTELDELVREDLDARLGGALSRWDPGTPEGAHARGRILAACVRAKETLSDQAVAEVRVPLPTGNRRAFLRREDADALFRRPVGETVDALRRVVAAAPARPEALVLAGGSARIPLVTTLVRDALGSRVRIARAPDDAVARGAAQLAACRAGMPAPPARPSPRRRTPAPAPARGGPPLGAGPAPDERTETVAPEAGRRPGQNPDERTDTVALGAGPRPGPAPDERTETVAPDPATLSEPTAPVPWPGARRRGPGPLPAPGVRGPAHRPPPAGRPAHPAAYPPPRARPPQRPVAPPPAAAGPPGPPPVVRWAGPHPNAAGPVTPAVPGPPGAEPATPSGGDADTSWRNPAIGRQLAVALAVLAVVVALGVIVFVVLNRADATAGLLAPRLLGDLGWT
ncbi:Hsp70 family protein [Pseudonocardia sp. 73-21]|uniref:Hsp70 family protein n=2 Tax=unclassified Pseudonocardia TaxID=2619320 RepID=UPI00095AF58D|nr:Hsp70 family protein [Pseudonocardia sp. 73-21]OJY39081.1 MAG: hypothetical protein BGP03_02445 [Pseudonocardia sp. 73-21]